MKMKNFIIYLFVVCLFASLQAVTMVTPGTGTLGAAINNAAPGDTLYLTGGAEYTHYGSASFAEIDKPITIMAEPEATEKAIICLSDSADSGSYYFFMIKDGASLTMKGLDIHGMINNVLWAKSMIKFDGRPVPSEARVGTIRIEDCVFHDFIDNIFHGMTESTMLGMIQDSLFIDNVMVYNAQAFLQYKHVSLRYLELKNSTMYKLSSMAIKIGKERYRGYTKISPAAFVDHCTFDDMGGAHGHIQVDDAFFPFTVSNCIISNIQDPNVQPALFMNNPQIDTAAIVLNTCFWNSGVTASPVPPYWPGYVFQDSITRDPLYENAYQGLFALPEDSPLLSFGTEGDAIGDLRWGTYQPSGIGKTNSPVEQFILYDNYPNPFNPQTEIRFSLPHTENVLLQIFDSTGKLLATLISQTMTAGQHTIKFNAGGFASGTYYYAIQAGQLHGTKKMVLLK